MTKVGRNDPCTCGSGRKYKRCCLGREAERDAFARALEVSALPLLQAVARYAERAAAMPAAAVAQREFPFWRGDLTPERVARVVDFLIFDYRLPHYGHSAVRQYGLEHANSLNDEQRAALEAWEASHRKPYRITGWSAGFAHCAELLVEDAMPIEVWALGDPSAMIPDGAPVALRALPAAGKHVCIGRPARFDERDVDEVAQAVKARHLDYVRRRRIVSLDDFYRLEPKALDEEAATSARVSGIVLPGA